MATFQASLEFDLPPSCRLRWRLCHTSFVVSRYRNAFARAPSGVHPGIPERHLQTDWIRPSGRGIVLGPRLLSHTRTREPAYAVRSPLPTDIYPRSGRARG